MSYDKDCDSTANQVRHSTLRERLHFQIKQGNEIVEHELQRIKEAKRILTKLDSNKELESIVDFLQSGR